MSATPSNYPPSPQTVPVAIIGTDALLAASPATPVQLAHACLQAGFANVVPASWGDELIAAAVLRRLPEYGGGPVIQCSCPIVAHRLLSVGGDLRPVMLPTVSPPVAIARYIRALAHPIRPRVTYVGGCPGAVDETIDIRMTPDALIAMLFERGIVLDDQPRVFESVIPPDRRRFRSLPGGLPAADALWNEAGARTLVEIDSDDLVAEVAQHLLGGKNVLIDAATCLGCLCSGAAGGVSPREARLRVIALEPPRAMTPVVEERAPIDLDLPVPAAPRTPIDIVATPPSTPAIYVTPPTGIDTLLGHRVSPVREIAAQLEPRASRPIAQPSPRPVLGAGLPVARDGDGRSLPRAYVARRRSSPRGLPAITLDPEETSLDEPLAPPIERKPVKRVVPTPAVRRIVVQRETPPAPATLVPTGNGTSATPVAHVPEPVEQGTPRRTLYLFAVAIGLACVLSAAVAIIVERALAAR